MAAPLSPGTALAEAENCFRRVPNLTSHIHPNGLPTKNAFNDRPEETQLKKISVDWAAMLSGPALTQRKPTDGVWQFQVGDLKAMAMPINLNVVYRPSANVAHCQIEPNPGPDKREFEKIQESLVRTGSWALRPS